MMSALRPLRPHQERAIDGLRSSLATGHGSPLLMLPTGAGKTICAAHIVAGLRQRGKRVCFTVPTIDLVDQTMERFAENGIPMDEMGALQGNHVWRRPHAPIQVATGQTLGRRARPDVDAVIVDEAHRRFKAIDDWMIDAIGGPIPSLARASSGSTRLPKPFFIGLSATPWARGMGRFYDDLIRVISTAELIEGGYLSPFRVYAPSTPDLTGIDVRRTGGGDYDYHEGQLAERMNREELVADVVSTWQTLGQGRPTLCFATGRAHAQALHDRFEAAGVPAAYVDANTPRDERAEIGRKLEAGAVKVVCNIGCLCLDEETEILTSDGFVGIDAMTDDHLIAAWHPDGIEFTKPKHIVRRQREPHENMVSVEGRVHNIRVTGNHRMLWSTTPWGFEVKSAEEIAGKRGYVPVSGEAPPAAFEIVGSHFEHETKKINALAYRYRKMGIDKGEARRLAIDHRTHQTKTAALINPADLTLDECRFIGFWLGDGTRANGRFSVSQSMTNVGVIDWFDGLIDRIGLHYTRTNYEPTTPNAKMSVRWSFSTGRGGRDQRRQGGVAYLDDYLRKDGSVLYWGLRRDQFKALVEGYWMADGNHGPDGNGAGAGTEIVGSNRSLLELLQAIGACRGLRIGFKVRTRRDDGTPSLYSIAILEQSSSMLHRERMHVEAIWRPERVWCVTSTTSYLITRRKGKVTVVGNTTGIDWDVRCLILARPTKSEQLFVQIIGRALRTAPGKDHAVILDHSSTHQRLGMVTDIDHDTLDDGKPPEKGDREAKERNLPLPALCEACTALMPAAASECPCCGFARPRPAFREQTGILQELIAGGRRVKAPSAQSILAGMDKRDVWAQLAGYQRDRGRSPGWTAHAYREVFGVWPRGMDGIAPQPPGDLVRAFVRAKDIRWAKSQPKRAEVAHA